MIFQDNKSGIGYFRSYFFRPKQKYLSAIKKIEKFQEAAEQNYICKFLFQLSWKVAEDCFFEDFNHKEANYP